MGFGQSLRPSRPPLSYMLAAALIVNVAAGAAGGLAASAWSSVNGLQSVRAFTLSGGQ